MSDIIFTKIRDVKSPSRAYGETESLAAGTDFFIPEYNSEFYSDLVKKNPNKSDYTLAVSPKLDSLSIVIEPGGRINIPSGIKVCIEDKNTCLLAVNKSGIASKKGLTTGACLVDSDYRGEIHINLLNVSNEPVTINTGDKIIQFMNFPVFYPSWNEVTNTDYDNLASKTDRGSGGFGSSGA